MCVNGFGTHIKSTGQTLIVQKKHSVDEIPLKSIKNLIIIGGHTINSATIINLVKNGTYISFFEPNGTPIGVIRPFGEKPDDALRKTQIGVPSHRFAKALAQASLKSRLIAIDKAQEQCHERFYYEGELQILHKSLEEMEYLIKLDEIRRLGRLASDMYYEIMSRNLPSDLGYRRRQQIHPTDPVNAMLSFGYSILFGNCCIPVIGYRLDPDIGMMYEGPGSFVRDLIEPFKAEMIDAEVFRYARTTLISSQFETGKDRCILSDSVIQDLTDMFHRSIDNEKISEQVSNFWHAIKENEEIRVLY